MKKTYRHIYTAIFLAVLMPVLAGCEDDSPETSKMPGKGTVPLAVNMTRAQGTAEGSYYMMFWDGKSGSDPLATLGTTGMPWMHSLKGTDTGATPAVGEVDYYTFGKKNYAITNNNAGGQVYYDENGTPIHVVGYYPGDTLSRSADYKTLTLNTTDVANAIVPGMVDVCSSQIETGTVNVPFVSSKDHELQYAHTQVKLNFNYQRTEDVNGRVAEIWVTIPDAQLADTWTLTNDGYVASNEVADTRPLIFASTTDYYREEARLDSMHYTVVGADKKYTIRLDKYDCYVLPDTEMFTYDGSQSYINFQLNAVIISSMTHIPNKIYNNKVRIPLTDTNGNPWTEKVKAGDAFTITITFDSKKLLLLAKKTKWILGGYINIPINPSL